RCRAGREPLLRAAEDGRTGGLVGLRLALVAVALLGLVLLGAERLKQVIGVGLQLLPGGAGQPLGLRRRQPLGLRDLHAEGPALGLLGALLSSRRALGQLLDVRLAGVLGLREPLGRVGVLLGAALPLARLRLPVDAVALRRLAVALSGVGGVVVARAGVVVGHAALSFGCGAPCGATPARPPGGRADASPP